MLLAMRLDDVTSDIKCSRCLEDQRAASHNSVFFGEKTPFITFYLHCSWSQLSLALLASPKDHHSLPKLCKAPAQYCESEFPKGGAWENVLFISSPR